MPDYDTLVERLAFLAKAGEILAAPLDVGDTMLGLARLALPVLGDLCIVDVVEDGVLRGVATAHADPAKTLLLQQLRRDYPLTPESPQPAARALRTGQIELLEHVTPAEVDAHVVNQAHAQLVRDIGIRSHLAVPLVARGVTVGVITLGVTESDRTYGEQDVALANDLARRAALAIDNARLFKDAQDERARRSQVEEGLRLSEERYRAIVDQSPLSTRAPAAGERGAAAAGAGRRPDERLGLGPDHRRRRVLRERAGVLGASTSAARPTSSRSSIPTTWRRSRTPASGAIATDDYPSDYRLRSPDGRDALGAEPRPRRPRRPGARGPHPRRHHSTSPS